MLKKLRKRLRRQRLAAALAAALAIAAPAAPARADIGQQAFMDGNTHMVTDNIVTSGAGTFGLGVQNIDTSADMSGRSITTTGANSHGASAVNNGAITLTNVAVTTTGAGSYALRAGPAGLINASVNGQDIAGAGGLLWADGGVINLTATGSSRLYGTADLTGGGTARLWLSGNAVWTVPGDSSISVLGLNGGTVSFTAPAAGGPYRTLSIDYELGGSGTFNLYANLQAGDSDLVRIYGLASGSHRMVVRSLGGSSATPRPVAKVVDFVEEAAPHTATFSGGGDIGAYRWAIARGSAVPAGYNGVDSQFDYYLYNTFAPSTPASAAVSAAVAPVCMWYGWFEEMSDLRKRLGELRLGKTPADDFWARTYAGKYTVKPGGGQSFDQISRGLEIGKDSPKAIAGGKRYLGWMAGAGRADNTFAAGGSGTTDSVYLGAYGTWLRDDGSYLDVVGKHNWFHSRFDAPVLGGGSDSAAYNNTGFGLSVETGRHIDRGGGVFVEPQAQLAALWSQGKNYTTASGLAVSAQAATSLQLRLGAVAGRKTALADGGSREVYGKLSWIQELAGQNRTTVDGVSFDYSLKGGRLVAGLGLVEDTARHQIYLDLETAWGKTTSKPWGANLGCRWKL